MLPEGVGRLFAPVLNDGPFPEHYEAVEAPVENVLHPKVSASPVLKRFASDKDKWGKADEYPIVCTTYRLTEHFHYWTKHQVGGRLNEVQPGIFFEIPEDLAKEKGIQNGETVRVTSARGSIEGPAMVTTRMPSFMQDGKRVWQIGFPIHWGYSGDAKHAGPLANLLTLVGHRPEHLDAGVQGLPGEAREGGEGLTMSIPGLEIIQSSASLRGTGSGLRKVPNVAKLIDTSTCIGCKACEVACQEWNDLPNAHTVQDGSYQTLPIAGRRLLEPHQVPRGRGRRQLQLADAQGSVHALRGSGLPQGLPRAGRHRPVLQRHRRREPRPVHRLPAVPRPAARSTCRASRRRPGRCPSARSAWTGRRWASSRHA